MTVLEILEETCIAKKKNWSQVIVQIQIASKCSGMGYHRPCWSKWLGKTIRSTASFKCGARIRLNSSNTECCEIKNLGTKKKEKLREFTIRPLPFERS